MQYFFTSLSLAHQQHAALQQPNEPIGNKPMRVVKPKMMPCGSFKLTFLLAKSADFLFTFFQSEQPQLVCLLSNTCTAKLKQASAPIHSKLGGSAEKNTSASVHSKQGGGCISRGLHMSSGGDCYQGTPNLVGFLLWFAESTRGTPP